MTRENYKAFALLYHRIGSMAHMPQAPYSDTKWQLLVDETIKIFKEDNPTLFDVTWFRGACRYGVEE